MSSSSAPTREIWVTNTATGKKEPLQTIEPGKLRYYSCGPTVYSYIHIGNLRAALTSDLFFRVFKRAGYDVTFVRNYTDVDDKIIDRGKEEGIGALEVARKYTVEVEKDYALAGMLEPTHKTKVTEHIPEIISMIQNIVTNGHGYVVEGEVFFSIESFKTYGEFSGRKIDDLQAGIRVDVRSQKKNPLDFSLWKPAKPGEISWPSPWGEGRPGWHIECSAMANKWLGDQIDVHHGGIDLVFPHHENEIAQSESACGKAPYVRYWLHNGFVNLSNEKMSKSLGNVISARDFLARYGTEISRYLLLSSHYRSVIDFAPDTLENTLQALERIYEAKKKASELAALRAALPDQKAEAAWGHFAASCEQAAQKIDECYYHDFNTAGALAELFTLIREFNRICAEPRAQATPTAVLGSQALIRVIEDGIGSVIGVGRSTPEKMLGEIARIRSERPAEGGASRPGADEIAALIEERKTARAAKNFARGDEIRKDLDARGVEIKDSPNGTTWKYK